MAIIIFIFLIIFLKFYYIKLNDPKYKNFKSFSNAKKIDINKIKIVKKNILLYKI